MKRIQERLMVKTNYFGALTIWVVTAATLIAMLLVAQKPAEAVVVPGDLCLPGPGADCPPETTIIYGPTNGSTTNLTTASFEFKGSDDITSSADLKFECKLDSEAFGSCSSPKEYTDLSNGSHTFWVRAIDSAGKVDGTPDNRTWTIDTTQPPPPDTTPPETSLTSWPTGPDPTVSFKFTGRDNFGGTAIADLKFECKLDSEAFGSCSSPKEYTDLSNGWHTFQARAIDSAGNVDPTPAGYQFRVDTTPPDTIITTHPSDPSNGTNPTFGFIGRDDVSNILYYRCWDSPAGSRGDWTVCTSPHAFSGITTSGTYTFEVAAVDGWGRPDPTPASYTWTVDATAPTISDVSPAHQTQDVATNTNAEATFSEDMDSSSITDKTFTLSKDGTSVAAHVSYDSASKKATLNPDSDLAASTTYTATITTGVKDSVGNALAKDYTWTFTTASPPGPPAVVSYTPTETTGVPRNTHPTATFSTNMDKSTITDTNIKLEVYNKKKKKWISAAHTVSYDADSRTATVTPGSTLLAASKKYRVTITTNVKSSTGVTLDQDGATSGNQPKTWSFITGST